MSSTRWDPDLYLRHADPRARPFFDLVARIAPVPRMGESGTGEPGSWEPRTVVDLGCGPGHLTAALADRWPGARVLGLDSSPQMVAKARAAHGPDAPAHRPNLAFEQADAGAWEPDARTDVVVTNAMLQWIPGHLELVGRWLDALAPGAWFAAQVPGNFGAPSHALLRGLAASPRWAGRLGRTLHHAEAVAEPDEYLRLLLAHGFEADVWETTYQHVLEGTDPVLEWVRGAALRPVLDALDAQEAAAFEDQYGAALRTAYPAFPGPRGQALTVFPFRRIFLVGRKAG
ncbi:trans-aconitate 2-methyltransferase [Zafaria cholistanensis]|uniref:Trans-aconitate 2-methyltransferase n=1 Tax=Zafaria cholistanensis TaxID=1682741 RepID=A0A5A7NRE9_9MICC|nr:methyltransferase domain-containing protein [Zafaria cholistanensis]GER23423.1 trans-aconitate 2-methyltransferase [Zafaria cholistanensis]